MTRTHQGKIAVALAAILMASSSAISLAQPAAPAKPSAATPLAAVPTIKLLAIGSFTANATPKKWKLLLHSEMSQTARLYLAGKIDQWYVKQDHSGVVFILNLTDPKEACVILGALPLGQAGLMKFQIVPLGPLSPLRTLLPEQTSAEERLPDSRKSAGHEIVSGPQLVS